jgi:ABC-type cobalamin/Fe3+-siderophores transport system ATPase subunit
VTAGLRLDSLSVARLGSLVVRDVSPTLEPGRLVTMLGPNGAGKTTLPEALAGMLGFASDRATLHGSDLGWLPGPPGLARHPAPGLPRDRVAVTIEAIDA